MPGRASHGARINRSTSYNPSGAATATPAATVIGSTHRRQASGARSDMSIPVASATSPGTTLCHTGTSGGRLAKAFSTIKGTAEMATSITTVPLTVGVKIRRNDANRHVTTTCSSMDATSRLASRPGPPLASASVEIAMNGTLKFVTTRPPRPR